MLFLQIIKCFRISSKIGRLINIYNNDTIEHVHRIAKTDENSKIRWSITKERKNTRLTPCAVRPSKVSGSDIIDLRENIESRSSKVTNGAEVWKTMFELTKDDTLLVNVVSGLKHSVTTHIAVFYYDLILFYLPNPYYYYRRYNDSNKDAMYFLYYFILSALGKLNDPRVKFLETSVDVKFNITSGCIEKLEKVLDSTSILDCDKCRLWATVQIKGIIVAAKIHLNMPIEKNDFKFIINVFARLSTTVRESKKFKFSYLYQIRYYIVITLITVIGISLCIIKPHMKLKSGCKSTK